MIQIDRVMKKVFGTLVFISKGTEYRNWDIMLQHVQGIVEARTST